jgi:ABC-2 type transport system permease protein
MKRRQKDSVKSGREVGAALPGWWVVAKKELAELWLGGRAMMLMILFSVLLGIVSFLLATNSEMKLMPPLEMLFMTIQNTIAVGLFVGMIIGADSISGERERATLEGLLLVPTSRRQIVIGKFVAAISPWPVALLLATVHLNVLAPNPEAFMQSLFLGGVLGSLLVIGFTGFGVLLSLWTESNRTSLFTGLFTTILFLIPTQFPYGTAQAGFMGQLVKRINPIESVNQFIEKLLVNNRTFEEMASWLAAPIIFAVVVFGVLFWYAAPRLALDSRKARLPWSPKLKRAPVVAVTLAALCLSLQVAGPASAQTEDPASPVRITIDKSYLEVKTGDSTEFTTVVEYNGTEESTPMVVAMNIVNLGEGDPVDPEDWSPERSQSVEPLEPGESAELNWTINAILEGDYMAYLTVIPEPRESGETSQPVSSPGIRLLVAAYSPLNPRGILPVALGMPIGLSLIFGLQKFLRQGRRKSMAES